MKMKSFLIEKERYMKCFELNQQIHGCWRHCHNTGLLGCLHWNAVSVISTKLLLLTAQKAKKNDNLVCSQRRKFRPNGDIFDSVHDKHHSYVHRRRHKMKSNKNGDFLDMECQSGNNSRRNNHTKTTVLNKEKYFFSKTSFTLQQKLLSVWKTL